MQFLNKISLQFVQQLKFLLPNKQREDCRMSHDNNRTTYFVSIGYRCLSDGTVVSFDVCSKYFHGRYNCARMI